LYYRWYCGAPSLPSLTSLASSSRWFSFANNTTMPQTPANSPNEIYEALTELWFLDNTDNIFAIFFCLRYYKQKKCYYFKLHMKILLQIGCQVHKADSTYRDAFQTLTLSTPSIFYLLFQHSVNNKDKNNDSNSFNKT